MGKVKLNASRNYGIDFARIKLFELLKIKELSVKSVDFITRIINKKNDSKEKENSDILV